MTKIPMNQLFTILQGVQDQIFQNQLALALHMTIFLDKLVKPKCVSCPNISYGKKIFSKNLENLYKSKEIL